MFFLWGDFIFFLCLVQSTSVLLSSSFLCFCVLYSHPLPPLSDLPPLPLSPSVCFRALQCWRLGDDVCDVADRVSCGCVCVWVLQPSGLQPLSGRWTRWETWTHTFSDKVRPGSMTISCAQINELVCIFQYSQCTFQTGLGLGLGTLHVQNFFSRLDWMTVWLQTSFTWCLLI